MSSWHKVHPRVRAAAARLPQSPLITGAAHRMTSRSLRILGMHGVPDLWRFEALVDRVRATHHVVSEAEVAHSITTATPLPPHSVWFTFDDGLSSTFAAGDLLASKGVQATAFVCPSVIDSSGWLWFQAVQAALDRGLLDATELPGGSLSALKRQPHSLVQDVTRVAHDLLDHARVDAPTRVGLDDVRRWRDQGHGVGNHTWGHPCLDTCPVETQHDQINRAHRALAEWGIEPAFFAYPNGNWTQESEDLLARLGYTGSLLFDHGLTRSLGRPHRLSRLRMDADCEVRRADSILSGAHSAMLRMVTR